MRSKTADDTSLLVRLLPVGLIAALLVTIGLAVAEQSRADAWNAYCWGCSYSPGFSNRHFGPGVNGLTRSTNYSTGSSYAGTGIERVGGAEYHTQCSSNGCTADTGNMGCGSWFNGAQPFAWNHSSWGGTFNSAYYNC